MNPDHDSLATEEFLHRLARHYRPGHWVGGVRKAFGAVTEVADTPAADLESHPPHYLAALWKPLSPAQPFLQRMPAHAVLVTPDPVAAVRGLLVEVPSGERLWLTTAGIDWALVAQIVMLGEKNLAPYQYRELGNFAKAEERALMAAISVHYEGGDTVFSQFARTTPGALD